jgi:uncharacterized membrane protein
MIKTEFNPNEKWDLQETGEADVYRIVKADNSDWIAVLRCNAIHNPGFQSGDGVTNVKAMVAAPDMVAALEDAKKQIEYLRSKLSAKMYNYTTPTTTGSLELIDKAINKATK